MTAPGRDVWLPALIEQWRCDPSGTYMGWCLWVERLKNFRSIRRGVAAVVAEIEVDRFGNVYKDGARLEYPMQLGAGTVSLVPGLSYVGQAGDWGWGVDALRTLRFDDNRYNYRVGNQYRINAWGMRRLTERVNLSARADARRVDNISGTDDVLDREDEPTKDPDLQAGRRLDLLLGLNFHPSRSTGREHQRLYFEVGVPAYQLLDGPQLSPVISVV